MGMRAKLSLHHKEQTSTLTTLPLSFDDKESCREVFSELMVPLFGKERL